MFGVASLAFSLVFGPSAATCTVAKSSPATTCRANVVVCPKCLAEDSAAAHQTRPPVAASQRARWQALALKTCAIHLTQLLAVEKDMTPRTMHDWSHCIGKVLPDLLRLIAAVERARSQASQAISSIAAMVDRTGCSLTDTLPLHVAITDCELFGAVASFGRMPNLKTIADQEWRPVGAAGFDIVAGGQPGIERKLSGPTPTRAPPTRVRRPSSAAGTKFSSSVARTPTSRY